MLCPFDLIVNNKAIDKIDTKIRAQSDAFQKF